MTKSEIAKAVKKGKMKMFDIPFDLPDSFIEKWNSQSNEYANKGVFINIKKIENGINILSIGDNPELALFLVGLGYGTYNK